MYTKEDVKRAKANGVSYNVFYLRVVVHKWDIEKAITTPVNKNTLYTKEDVKRAKKNGVPSNTFYSRVKVLKWDIEKAITTPVDKKIGNRGRYFTDEEIKTAKENGICRGTMMSRKFRGWDREKIPTTPLRHTHSQNRKKKKPTNLKNTKEFDKALNLLLKKQASTFSQLILLCPAINKKILNLAYETAKKIGVKGLR